MREAYTHIHIYIYVHREAGERQRGKEEDGNVENGLPLRGADSNLGKIFYAETDLNFVGIERRFF